MRKRRSLLPALIALTAGAACTASPTVEGQLLRSYVEACRRYDTVALARLATAPCDPRVTGVVRELEIVAVGEERRSAGAPAAKEVTLNVRIRSLDGQATAGMATATLQRVDGRWIVGAFTPPPASRTSPAASSAPPR